MNHLNKYLLILLCTIGKIYGMQASIPDLKTLAARAVMRHDGLYAEAVFSGTLPAQCHELIQAEKNKIKSFEPLINRLSGRCNQTVLLPADRADMLEVAQQSTAAYLAMDTTCNKNGCRLGLLAISLPWKQDFDTSLALFKIAIGKKHLGYNNQCCYAKLFDFGRELSEEQRKTVLLAALPTLTKKQRCNLWEKYPKMLCPQAENESFAQYELPCATYCDLLTIHNIHPTELQSPQARKILLKIASGQCSESSSHAVCIPFLLERAACSTEEITNLLAAIPHLTNNNPLTMPTAHLINLLIANEQVHIPETLIRKVFSHSISLVSNDWYSSCCHFIDSHLLQALGTDATQESINLMRIAIETAYYDANGIIQHLLAKTNSLHNITQNLPAKNIGRYLHRLYIYCKILHVAHSAEIKAIPFDPTPFATSLYETITKLYCLFALNECDVCFSKTVKTDSMVQQLTSSLIADIIASDCPISELVVYWQNLFELAKNPIHYPLFDEAMKRCPLRFNILINDNLYRRLMPAHFKIYAFKQLLKQIQEDKTTIEPLIYPYKLRACVGGDMDENIYGAALDFLHQIIENSNDSDLFNHILACFGSLDLYDMTTANNQARLFSLLGNLINKIEPQDASIHGYCARIVNILINELFVHDTSHFGDAIISTIERYPECWSTTFKNKIEGIQDNYRNFSLPMTLSFAIEHPLVQSFIRDSLLAYIQARAPHWQEEFDDERDNTSNIHLPLSITANNRWKTFFRYLATVFPQWENLLPAKETLTTDDARLLRLLVPGTEATPQLNSYVNLFTREVPHIVQPALQRLQHTDDYYRQNHLQTFSDYVSQIFSRRTLRTMATAGIASCGLVAAWRIARALSHR